jgi:hypothetical protein
MAIGKFYPQYKAVDILYPGAELHVFFIDFSIHLEIQNSYSKSDAGCHQAAANRAAGKLKKHEPSIEK